MNDKCILQDGLRVIEYETTPEGWPHRTCSKKEEQPKLTPPRSHLDKRITERTLYCLKIRFSLNLLRDEVVVSHSAFVVVFHVACV
jgi:hypothetical protein